MKRPNKISRTYRSVYRNMDPKMRTWYEGFLRLLIRMRELEVREKLSQRHSG